MSAPPASDVSVREAAPEDRPAVMNVLEGANLEVDADAARERIASGDVLVAVAQGRVLGALVAVPRGGALHVDAIAVRRGRRGQGIGTALVAAVAERADKLTAEFDAGVRQFYDALGFAVESIGGGRYRGVLHEGPD